MNERTQRVIVLSGELALVVQAQSILETVADDMRAEGRKLVPEHLEKCAADLQKAMLIMSAEIKSLAEQACQAPSPFGDDCTLPEGHDGCHANQLTLWSQS